jgi:cell division septation protein DedD
VAASAATTSVPALLVTPVAGTAAAAGVTVAPLSEPVPQPAKAPDAQRGWSVQLGAFTQEGNAEALAGRTAALLSFLDPGALSAGTPRIERDGSVYRVLLGASADRSAAQALARELEKVLERPTTVVLR